MLRLHVRIVSQLLFILLGTATFMQARAHGCENLSGVFRELYETGYDPDDCAKNIRGLIREAVSRRILLEDVVVLELRTKMARHCVL